MEKKLKNGIDGEDLNLLLGNIPYGNKSEAEAVKLNILNIFRCFKFKLDFARNNPDYFIPERSINFLW